MRFPRSILANPARNGAVRGMHAVGATAVWRRILQRRHGPLARVLCFHRVPDVAAFRHKMRLLKARYRVVDLRAVTMGIGLDADTLNVAITFDDGFPEQLDAAAAVLREEEVPAAFFVITGALDLAPPQAEEFYRSRVRAASGESATSQAVAAIGGDPLFEIGSHSATHADLGALGDGAGLRDELGGSRASLERIVGRSVESFAYPFGAQANLSPQAEAAAREAGYTSAWTTLPGFNSRATDRFRLHRDNLEPSMDDGLFVAWIEGGYDLVRWGADLLRGRG